MCVWVVKARKSDNQWNYTHYLGRILFYFPHRQTQEDLFIHVWHIAKWITWWQHEISCAVKLLGKKQQFSQMLYFFFAQRVTATQTKRIKEKRWKFNGITHTQVITFWKCMNEDVQAKETVSNCSDENGILRNFITLIPNSHILTCKEHLAHYFFDEQKKRNSWC